MDKKIRVCHIRDSSGMFGAERVIITLLRNIDTSKFLPSAVLQKKEPSLNRALLEELQNIGIECFEISVTGKFDFRAISRLRYYLVTRNIDIIHTHDFKSNLYGLLATRGTGIKRVVTVHGSTRDSLKKRLYLYLDERFICTRFDKVIAVSKDMLPHLAKRKVKSSQVAVIQNCFDPSLLIKTTRKNKSVIPGESNHTFIFAVVGRVYPDKGHRFFLEAFAKLLSENYKISAWIIGDGPGVMEVESLIEYLNLKESVSMCGRIENMVSVYHSINCLVISSLTEGLPYVLLEAMFFGVPVVATRVGDIPDIIKDSESGVLVDPASSDELFRGMKQILAHPQKADSYASKASEIVRERFSYKRMLEETEEVYQQILKRKENQKCLSS